MVIQCIKHAETFTVLANKQTHDQLVQNEGIRYMKDNHETIVSTNVICSGLCRHNLCFGKGL